MRSWVPYAAFLATACHPFCSAAPSASKYVLHEERSNLLPSSGLQARSKLDVTQVLPIRIGLAQRNLHLGDEWLMDVAHPESKNYGKHWTAAEVNKAFAPTPESVQSVSNWLIDSGIDLNRISLSDNKGWLAFDASVEEAERLFLAQYYEHGHADEDKYTVGCDSYYLPEHIQQHIDYVTPAVKHQLYKREQSAPTRRLSKRSKRGPITVPIQSSAESAGPEVSVDAKSVPLNCSSYVVNADCIRSMYGLPAIDVNKKINTNNALGIFEQQVQPYSPEDLEAFFKNFMPEANSSTIPLMTSVDGGVGVVNNASLDGGEAMLDITIAYSLIYPQEINFIDVDDSYYQENYYYKGFGDTLLDALDGSFCTYSAFGQKGDNNTIDPIYPDSHEGGYPGPLECGTYTPPKVISFSYGPGEIVWPVNYERRQCNEWMKLALQGTTAVFASGDSGVSNQVNDIARDSACLGPDNNVFTPAFPLSCPYVLAVGATQIKPYVSGLTANPEMAVDVPEYNFTSGGGFSNVFERPSYQNDAVNNYFKISNNTLPYYKTTNGKNIGENGGLFNRRGRGIPDVSANGAYWQDYAGGLLGRAAGTSMSTPLWASVVNLLNEARLNAGKSSVGFLHPTLYAHPEAFHDITVGSSNGCGLDVAFETAPGWDPVTGLGTPKFEKLLEIFLSLP